MYYEKGYWLNWTWHYTERTCCYSDNKYFETEEQAEVFRKELFNNPRIEVVWCKKTCEETWEKHLTN